jgi:hypothetical protein
MEKYQMPMSNMQLSMPQMQAPYSAPAPTHKPMTSAIPTGGYVAPITVNASYEEINLYETKKHHHHHHAHCHPVGGSLSVGAILVLYILLVIILRGFGK